MTSVKMRSLKLQRQTKPMTDFYYCYNDEEEKFQASSFLAIYVVIGVVLAVLVIGKILLLIRYVHLRKSRVNIPNQINIILKNTEDTDDQDSKLQLTRPMVTNNQCEDTGIDYNYMSVSLQ